MALEFPRKWLIPIDLATQRGERKSRFIGDWTTER
jgi:hypothetical protein